MIESIRKDLADAGVLQPTADLQRAVGAARYVAAAQQLLNNGDVPLETRELLAAAEASVRRLYSELLARAPVGASCLNSDVLVEMARDAVADLGPSTNVHLETEGGENSSRYVQYLLRCTPARDQDKEHGIAVVRKIWANGKSHVFPRSILIASGDGLADPRGPFHYLRLVEALHAAGLVTNDGARSE